MPRPPCGSAWALWVGRHSRLPCSELGAPRVHSGQRWGEEPFPVGVRSPSPPGSWAAAESFPRAQAAVSRPGPGSGAERALLHRIIWNCGARPDAQSAALRCEPQSPTRSGCAAVGSSETLSHRPWGPGPPSCPITVTEGGVRETLPGGGPVLVLPVSSKHLAHHSCPDARSTAGGTL